MEETKKMLRDALRSIPELKTIPGIGALIERVPGHAEFAAANAKFEASIDADRAAGLYEGFEASLEIDFDFDDLPPPPDISRATPEAAAKCNTSTKLITIRITSPVLHAIKVKAKQKGVKYQTLINRMLKVAVDGWKLPEGKEHPSL